MTHHHKSDDESSDETVELPAVHKQCPYEKDKDKWFDGKLLKIIGIVYGIATPLVTWIVVSIFTMQSDLILLKQKQEIILDMRQDLKTITTDINLIKLDVNTLKVKANVQ